ncbi:MAG: fused MFS/spermidine synthase [Methylococcales bacterium]|jgi:predicted membrane-bound spermidine synthase|nr:fused MFS/spermidine synthase [Methylococcales bacterium]MBT7444435.1 fused MFS/spermidine synthase [Methylococcales bacterium]
MTLLNPNQAKLFLFLEGLVAVSIQFLFLRLLIPYVGSSVVVTSIVITLFLAALAGGYEMGGKVLKNHQQVLQRNLRVAALFLGFGGSMLMVDAFFSITPLPPILQLFIFCTLFMVPTTFLIAQTVPLLINFLGDQNAAHLAGSALKWSTIGNVFGGLVTTLVIMYWLGFAWAITLNALLLATLSFILNTDKFDFNQNSIFVGLLALMIWLNLGYEQHIFVKSTAYANYQILHDDKEGRYFINNRSNASYTNPQGKTHAYARFVRDNLFETHKMHDKNILVLGAGGFTLSQKQPYKNKFTYVDIDGQIADVARNHFLHDGKINGQFVAQDGRAFLRNTTKQWDVIIVDAFTNRHDTPWHLSTVEFFQSLRTRLVDDGILVINLLASPRMNDPYSKRMDNTIRSVFPSCHSNLIVRDRHNKPVGAAKLMGVVYTCYAQANEHDKTRYHDDNTQITIDSFKLK